MKKDTKEHENVENTTEMEENTVSEENISETEEQEEETAEDSSVEEKDDLSEMKDKYLRLYSEFDNYRRRTSKEKLEVIATANADLMSKMLPTLDDFERAIKAIEDSTGSKAEAEGLQIIYKKFKKTLEQAGLKEINAKQGTTFDVELHEAISQIPAPSKKLKGKIVDVVETGYFLKDKVIRFAKVVVGS